MGDACDSCPEMSNPTQVQGWGRGWGERGLGASPSEGKRSSHPLELPRDGENWPLSRRQTRTATWWGMSVTPTRTGRLAKS